MIKLIYPDANEELLASCEGSLAKVITSDLKSIKQASSNSITKEMLEECKPDKDHFLIHFIGVGDYEKYGFNKNADAFTKEANQKYYKTFEEGGHLFREHNSSNPEVNAIGQLKKAMYNPEMGRIELAVWGNIKKAAQEYEEALAGKPLSCSMGCFPRGTKVTMEDGSYKTIEEIKINDIIQSGSNNASNIVDTFNYKYSGNKISLNAVGLTEPIVCTGNHPIFIRRYTTSLLQDAPAICPVCGAHVKYLKTHIKRFKDDKHKAFWNTYKEALSKYEEKFVDADQVQAGDYLVSICDLPNKSNTQEEINFARFLGYFVAEGNFIKYRGKDAKLKKNPYRAVQLNFSINEDAYVNEVVSILKSFCPNTNITTQKRDKKNVYIISMYNKDFATKVFNACNEYSHGKILDQKLINNWGRACRENFLDAYVNGDGTFSKINNTLSWTTVSKSLAAQLQNIANSLGLTPHFYITEEKLRNCRNVNHLVKHREFYTGTLSQKDLYKNNFKFSKISDNTKLICNNDLVYASQFVENNLCYHKISNINIESVNDFEVFNLEVENDHTYLAQNIIVHNCSIKFDRDSITGKLCANSSQYEEHMKKHPGQYIPEYKKYAFVYNDTPKFFDLSIVKRPAERIAHYLEYKFASDNTKDWLKTASDNNGCIPSVLLAEMEGIKYSLETKFASQKKSSLLDQLKQKENEFADAIANKSASDSISIYIKGAAINSFSKDYELSNEELKSIADSKIRPESFFRELAKRASVLSFNSFVNYIYPEKDECKDEAIKLASTCMLPCLFNNLEDTGIDISALEDIFNSGSALDCIADNADADPVQDLMDQVSEKFSLDEDKKEKRIINITIINANNDKNNLDQILPSILKSASEVDTNSLLYNKAKKYAASYAVYKIAAINDIEKFKGEKLNDASLYSLIAQNYIYNF